MHLRRNARERRVCGVCIVLAPLARARNVAQPKVEVVHHAERGAELDRLAVSLRRHVWRKADDASGGVCRVEPSPAFLLGISEVDALLAALNRDRLQLALEESVRRGLIDASA